MMQNSWRSLDPRNARAFGDTKVHLSGFSFIDGSPGRYQCRLSGLSALGRSTVPVVVPVVVLNTTHAYSISPAVDGASRLSQVDILLDGISIPWSPAPMEAIVALEGRDDVCWDPACCSWPDSSCCYRCVVDESAFIVDAVAAFSIFRASNN